MIVITPNAYQTQRLSNMMYQGSASINLCNARNHLWKEGPPLQWKETEARGKELRTGVRRPRLALPLSLTPEPRLWHTRCCEFQVQVPRWQTQARWGELQHGAG